MRLRQALHAIPRRLARPLVLGLTLGMILLNVLSLWASTRLNSGTTLTLAALSGAVIWPLYRMGLSPFAWQWTRDARLLARPTLGILQSLVLTGCYALVMAWVQWEDREKTLAMTERLVGLEPGGLLVFVLVVQTFGAGVDLAIGFALAHWEARTEEKAQALRQAEAARWSLLKAQMSPHVLLNSLNGLAELVHEDPEAAAQGMRDLAELYHHLLALGNAPLVPLGEERRLLERYLGVEQLRLGSLLQVHWDWDPSLDPHPALPLLLQPLVENALKHGVAADPNGGELRIEARTSPLGPRLRVLNTGTAPPRKGTGTGLKNLRARLELAYGDTARFHLHREDGWMVAELQLPPEVCP